MGPNLATPRLRATLTALLLVAAGIFGMLTYSVTRRTREIGLRMAVGAAPGAVTRMVIREMLGVTAAGMVVGVLGALASGALIRNLLFGIEPTDPATFMLVGLFVLLMAGAASYVPARRAARIDPVVTLKQA